MAFADHPDVQTVSTFIDRAARSSLRARPSADGSASSCSRRRWSRCARGCRALTPSGPAMSCAPITSRRRRGRGASSPVAPRSPAIRLRRCCQRPDRSARPRRAHGRGLATLTLTVFRDPRSPSRTAAPSRSAPRRPRDVQLRPHHPATSTAQAAPIAALGSTAASTVSARSSTFGATPATSPSPPAPRFVFTRPARSAQPAELTTRDRAHWWPGPLSPECPSRRARQLAMATRRAGDTPHSGQTICSRSPCIRTPAPVRGNPTPLARVVPATPPTRCSSPPSCTSWHRRHGHRLSRRDRVEP